MEKIDKKTNTICVIILIVYAIFNNFAINYIGELPLIAAISVLVVNYFLPGNKLPDEDYDLDDE